MARKSVIKYNFRTRVVRKGGVTFDPANLDSFESARARVAEIRAELDALGGTLTGVVEITTMNFPAFAAAGADEPAQPFGSAAVEPDLAIPPSLRREGAA